MASARGAPHRTRAALSRLTAVEDFAALDQIAPLMLSGAWIEAEAVLARS